MVKTCKELEKEYDKKTEEYKNLMDRGYFDEADKLFEEKMRLLGQMGGCKVRASHHTQKWHRCVHDVSKKGTAINPFAVCSASVGK